MPEISHALTESVTFVPDDFELLDLALHISPELRLAASGLKLARAAHVQYPMTSINDIASLIPSGRIEAAGHVVTVESLSVFFPTEFIPIEGESDLLAKMYIALIRCQEETRKVIAINPVIHDHVMGVTRTAKPGNTVGHDLGFDADTFPEVG